MQEYPSWLPAVPLFSRYRSKARSTSCLPAQVVDDVPSCALSCVESFVQTVYGSASCADTSQLDFLCTHNTLSGFTIGEGALQCLVSDCSTTPSSETLVYNICASVANAVPETMATITATVAPSSSLISTPISSPTNALPPSIAKPSSTQSVLSFVTASGTPFLSTISSPSSTSTTFSTSTSSSRTYAIASNSPSASSAQPGPQAANTTAAAIAKMQRGLSTGQIAGIAVAGIFAAVAVFTILLCVYCIRKRRGQRRQSQRWSTVEFPQHPTVMEQQHLATGAAVTTQTFPHSQRYYAQASTEEKRRSFWRENIKPEEIGVALSPEGLHQGSPTSISSQKSVSRLLPGAPASSLCPAPSKRSVPVPPSNRGDRPESNATVFEDTDVNNVAQYHPQTRVAPYETRLSDGQYSVARTLPSIDVLNQAHDAESARVAGRAARIPLTPIYDNGNFGSQSQQSMPSRAAGAYQWNAYPLQSTTPPASQSNLQDPRGLNISAIPRLQIPSQRKEFAHRSVASNSTDFEEDTTPPDEIGRQTQMINPTQEPGYMDMASRSQGETFTKQTLMYPRVPRPAAVSQQAGNLRRTLATDNLNTVGRRLEASSGRDQLALLVNNTTSSQGHSTNAQPSSLAQRRAEQGGFGQQTDLKIRTANPAAAALNQRWRLDPRPMAPVPHPLSARYTSPKTPEPFSPPRSGFLEARVTPKANSRGDLYLTVEG